MLTKLQTWQLNVTVYYWFIPVNKCSAVLSWRRIYFSSFNIVLVTSLEMFCTFRFVKICRHQPFRDISPFIFPWTEQSNNYNLLLTHVSWFLKSVLPTVKLPSMLWICSKCHSKCSATFTTPPCVFKLVIVKIVVVPTTRYFRVCFLYHCQLLLFLMIFDKYSHSSKCLSLLK